MPFKSVGYAVEYEISALIFLIVIMTRYFGAKRFPNQKNHMFSALLWIVALDIVLDIATSLIIDNIFLVPIWVTFVANESFYCMQVLLPLLLTIYTLTLQEYVNWKRLLMLLPLYLPGIAALILLMINPVLLWFFYVDPIRGYVRGPMFLSLYMICLLYMAAAFVLAYHGRKRMRKKEFSTICWFLAIVLAAMAIQFVYPHILISGVAIALAITLMYFTIQNPDSMLDASTGAFTYEAMLAFLRDCAQEQKCVQLIAIKINNMPRINELLGIESGSLLLKQVCDFLKHGAEDCWVFRMRGGCFVAITRKSDSHHVLCARLNEHIGLPWVVNKSDILLQATVCRVAADELLPEPISPEETINYLESVFLQNDRSGGRIVNLTLGSELLDQIRRKRAVEAALRKAVESGDGLELYFQPLWSVSRKRFVSAEVLLRFHHPEMGYISPDEFVPIAESCGFVTAMDEYVIREACAFIRDNECLGELGLETLEINISALEFMQRRLPNMLDEIMRQNRIDPCFLCFEITETAATESFELLRECMLDICKKGFRFALDDFGTGYANISQVIQLPFSVVKLDRSLLSGPGIVMNDMVHMFKRMNCRTVLEGVETPEQVALAESIGVDDIQGFYYARPMNRQNYLAFIRERAIACER